MSGLALLIALLQAKAATIEGEAHEDSTGKWITEGDRVWFRGKAYTIKGFKDGAGVFGSAAIEFVEEIVGTDEQPDEVSVDRID